MSAVARSRFYAWIALALTLIMFVGFARTLYLRPWFEVPPISGVLMLHGIAFTAWFALFVGQTQLVARGNVRLHRKLGAAGVVLALAVIATSLATVIEAAGSPQPRPMGLNSQQFASVPTVAIAGFAGFFAAAIALRRRPELHRRLMTVAMIFVMGPPVARILFMLGVTREFLFAQTAVTAVLIAWCLANDWLKHRVMHPIYVIGGILLISSWPFRFWLARTPQWEPVGRWMAGL